MNGLCGSIASASDGVGIEGRADEIALEITALEVESLVGSPWGTVRVKYCDFAATADLAVEMRLIRRPSEVIGQQRARKDSAKRGGDGQDVCLATVVTGQGVTWQQIRIEFVPIRVVNQLLDPA